MLSQRALNKIADSLEEYLNILDICIILDVSHGKKYKKAVKKMEKRIKKLRKGEWEGILEPKYVSMYADILEADNDGN